MLSELLWVINLQFLKTLVPNVGTTIFYKSDAMDFIEENKNATIKAKKGDIISLTHFETAKLLSTPEFNGDVTGVAMGSMKAVIAYQKPSATPKKSRR